MGMQFLSFEPSPLSRGLGGHGGRHHFVPGGCDGERCSAIFATGHDGCAYPKAEMSR